MTSAVPVRFTVGQHEALKMLAAVEGVTVSAVVRAAVDGYVGARMSAPGFRLEVEKQIERLQRMLEEEG